MKPQDAGFFRILYALKFDWHQYTSKWGIGCINSTVDARHWHFGFIAQFDIIVIPRCSPGSLVLEMNHPCPCMRQVMHWLRLVYSVSQRFAFCVSSARVGWQLAFRRSPRSPRGMAHKGATNIPFYLRALAYLSCCCFKNVIILSTCYQLIIESPYCMATVHSQKPAWTHPVRHLGPVIVSYLIMDK